MLAMYILFLSWFKFPFSAVFLEPDNGLSLCLRILSFYSSFENEIMILWYCFFVDQGRGSLVKSICASGRFVEIKNNKY